MGCFRVFSFNSKCLGDAPQCDFVIRCTVYYSYPCLYKRIPQSDLERCPNSYSWHIFGARYNSWVLVLDLLGLFQYSPSRRNDIYSSIIQSNERLVSQAKNPPAYCCSNALVWKCDLCIRFISHPSSGYNAFCFYD